MSDNEMVRIRLARLNRLSFGKSGVVDPLTGHKRARIWERGVVYLVPRKLWESDLQAAYDTSTDLRYFELAE